MVSRATTMSKVNVDVWRRLIEENGASLSDKQMSQLNLYHDLLKQWNSKINLISRKDEENIWPGHILHSITPLFLFEFPDRVSIADVGSGGGLPGVPLAVMLPKSEITMIESIKKKCEALKEIVSQLRLPNAFVVHGRAEDLPEQGNRKRQFDLVVARAVAPLKELIGWSLKLVASNRGLSIKTVRGNSDVGQSTISLPALLAFKGGTINEEISIAEHFAKGKRVHSFDIGFHGIENTGLVDKKVILVSLSLDRK
jgi:16S rRNA (guanine527-N7)-methyltransferase